MRVLAINGSPRRNGNTHSLVQQVFAPLQEAGIDTELIHLGGQAVRGCTACCRCAELQNGTCVLTDDPVNGIIAKMVEADGILLASPTYFSDVTAEMKALIDRAGFVSIQNGRLLAHKVGAAVVAVRRGGGIHVFDTINHFFQINRMFVVGSTYWNLGYGLEPGDVDRDEEGMANMTALGESMAFLLRKLAGNG
jgi:multimeric flavodoxin WrbA